MTKPFTPADAKAAKASSIPDVVLDVVNRLLAENFGSSDNPHIQFTSKKVRELVEPLLPEGTRFDARWLDFEGVYRRYGWDVEYDKPGYNETYDGFYIFRKKKGED